MISLPPAPTLLVVDDDEVARYRKVHTLRQAGFEVLQAASGPEALEMIERHSPRLVVLDVQLPGGMDGWEICKRIKADRRTSWMLVLQVSATFRTEADTVKALEGGADACLTEPIEAPVLIATVRALLRTRQAEDAMREALRREQAARKAADAANRAKDQFLATLSHELRSPLSAILTWTTLLRDGQLDAGRSQRAFDAIDRNTRLQVKLIDDLLDVSRVISGNMRLEIAPVELATVIEAALESVRTAAAAKGVRLELRCDPGVGPVMGDAARLQQVAWNLLSNAVKFTPRGGSVTVELDAVHSHARIRVVDTGLGVAAEFLPHIFERFRQADSSTTRREGGLGLGLAIVRHLVELHGGTVEATSPGIDQGATFTVLLPVPLSRPVSRDAGAFAASGGSDQPTLAGVTVLVVDDDDDNREAVALILERSGAEVRTAASAAEAVEAVAERTPTVIVSDIAMPGEDGFHLIRAVRALPADAGGTVPMLALSALASADDRERILAAGFELCISKPVEPSELTAAIGELLARHGRIDSSEDRETTKA